MPRPLRIIQQEVTYHCYSRCQGLNMFLLEETAKKCFLEAIKMCQDKYRFELNAVETVGDHFHLIIRTLKDEETIDRIMQYIKARTAEKYNKITKRKGPFWNERYKCRIVEHSKNPVPYYRHLLLYIKWNIVKKGLSLDPRDNYIGFMDCYLSEDYEVPIIKITRNPLFYKLGNTFEECAEQLRLYEKYYVERLLSFSCFSC